MECNLLKQPQLFTLCHTNGGRSFESWFLVLVLALEQLNLCVVLT